MLEDIRNHSPVPHPQELAWMAARPMRAVIRVVALGVIAVATAHVPRLFEEPAPPQMVVQAAPEARK